MIEAHTMVGDSEDEGAQHLTFSCFNHQAPLLRPP